MQQHAPGRAELDSHCDTCSFGKDAVLVYDTGETVSVAPFISSLGKVTKVPIGTVAIAYDCPNTLQTYILFFHQSLYFPDMHRHLISPAQLRHNQVVVNETPLLHMAASERRHDSHSILFNEPKLHIPLKLSGTISYFPTRRPTDDEINSDRDCIHINVTSESFWDPASPAYDHDEDSLRASLDSELRLGGQRMLGAVTSQRLHDESGFRSISAISAVRTSVAYDIDSYALALDDSEQSVSAITTKNRKAYVTPEALAKRWSIGIETARNTLKRTTQRAIRDFSTVSGTRRLKPFAYQLRYPRLNTEMYCDILVGTCVSLMGNKYAAVYCTPFHWICVDPIEKKSDAHYTLDNLFRRVGVPHTLIPDNAGELTAGDFRRKAMKAQSAIRPIEAHTPNANLAEDGIRELKRMYRRAMIRTNSPRCLWDLCLVYHAYVRSHSCLSVRQLDGEVPQTVLTGDTADISHICEFGWYDWVWYISPQDESMERKHLGRYLGPSFDVGDVLCARILPASARPISRTSVFPLSVEEENSPAVAEMKAQFTQTLEQKLKDRALPLDPDEIPEDEKTPEMEYYVPLEATDEETPPVQEADDFDHVAYDKYINARVLLPQGDTLSYGTVKRRKRDQNGNLIGRYDPNPLLDTALYEVEFDSREVEAYHANQIAEAIYAEVDGDGRTSYVLKEITDYKKESYAVPPNEAFVIHNNRKYPKRTTKGWKLCCLWNDGTTTWEKLKDLKESHPLQVAEFAVARQIDNEPAFVWWVNYTLKKRKRIVKAMAKRYFRVTQKYGIQLPKTVEEALAIDRETGTDFWAKAIAKEMGAVAKAFQILDSDALDPAGYTKIKVHMVFDIKPDFTRKARLVAGGHLTDPPSSITYASVVSRESVRIAFLLAALNGLDVLAGDIGNAYLNAPVRERIFIVCGAEFGPEFKGRKAKIVKALYGLKSSGAAWRSFLSECLHESLEFSPCRADNDVWIRPAQKADGSRYYEMVLVYTDDILCVSAAPDLILCKLDQHFLLKEGSIGKPTRYLGATIGEHQFPGDDKPCWSMSSNDYVKEAIRNVGIWLEDKVQELPKKASSVLPRDYRPELDVSPLCNESEIQFYHSQIGVLRWMVELGRVDICGEVSMLASHSAMPRKGHLDAVLHMFAYLKSHERSKIVFDPSYVEHERVPRPDWTDFYRDAKPTIPTDCPVPLGKPVQITCFVDADLAGDHVTRRSRTGVLIYLNRSLTTWYSKKQTSIETSTFGAEFSAMKTAVELIEGLRYKLQMMGVPIDDPAIVKGDNMSVIKNSSIPESVLKKKSNSVAYHYVRERVAMGLVEISYEPTKTNLADILTKIQPGNVRDPLVKRILHQ